MPLSLSICMAPCGGAISRAYQHATGIDAGLVTARQKGFFISRVLDADTGAVLLLPFPHL